VKWVGACPEKAMTSMRDQVSRDIEQQRRVEIKGKAN
jgi:hypothetical protein